MSLFLRLTMTLVFLACLVGVIVSFTLVQFLNSPASAQTEETVFEIKPGTSFRTVCKDLEVAGLITSGWKLRAVARVYASTNKVRVGEYAIKRNLKPREILAILSSGQSIQYPFTISEGLNRFEIAELLRGKKWASADEFLALTQDANFIRDVLGRDAETLEGYLFPETYFVTKYTGARGLIKMMVERFKVNFAKLQDVKGWQLGAFSQHELVTLASIIEKETGAPEERPMISSVFYNRLKKRMPLQTDPTVIYGMWVQRGAWDGNIKRADLKSPSKYNTYQIMGLPPGPIANPGFAALSAAGAPATSDYLFFVSKNDGTHVFSVAYSQHVNAVGQYQLDKKAREGKSWRDLKNREGAK